MSLQKSSCLALAIEAGGVTLEPAAPAVVAPNAAALSASAISATPPQMVFPHVVLLSCATARVPRLTRMTAAATPMTAERPPGADENRGARAYRVRAAQVRLASPRGVIFARFAPRRRQEIGAGGSDRQSGRRAQLATDPHHDLRSHHVHPPLHDSSRTPPSAATAPSARPAPASTRSASLPTAARRTSSRGTTSGRPRVTAAPRSSCPATLPRRRCSRPASCRCCAPPPTA